jgi:hypothetical protein
VVNFKTATAFCANPIMRNGAVEFNDAPNVAGKIVEAVNVLCIDM